MPCYNSELVQTVGVLKPLTVELSDQDTCSLSMISLQTAKAKVCSEHSWITHFKGFEQTLDGILLQQCGLQHQQFVHATLQRKILSQHPAQQRFQELQLQHHQQEMLPQQMTLATCYQQEVPVLPQQHKRSLYFTLEQDDTSPEQKKSQSDSVGSEVQSVGDRAEEVETAHRDHTDVDIHADACGKHERQSAFEDDEDSENAGLSSDGICQRLSTLKNCVNSVVTDMQTITKEMEAMDLEQNHLKYDC